MPLAEGATEVLAAVHGSGRTQSLLSMWRHHELVPLVRSRGLDRWFRRIDGLRGPGGGRKRRHLERHLRRLGVPPRDVVVVGDALDDAEAARAVGARCVLVASGSHHRCDLEGAGVPVVDDLPSVVPLLTGRG